MEYKKILVTTDFSELADQALDGQAFSALRDEIERDTGTDVRLITQVLRVDLFDTADDEQPPPQDAPVDAPETPPSEDPEPSDDAE